MGRCIAIALLLWLSVPEALAVGSTAGSADESRLELHKSAGPVFANSDSDADSDADGTYRVAIEILVRNAGSTKLYDVQILDEIAGQIAPAKVVGIEALSVSGDLQVLNPDFDGVAEPALLGGGEGLKPGAGAIVHFILLFDPQGAPGPFFNAASATAVDPDGEPVVDVCSASGTGGGSACGPALITLPEAVTPASVGLAKSAAESVLLPSGEFLTTLSFVLANLGEREVLGLTLIDDLVRTFAGSAGFRVVADSITGSGINVNPDYDGRDRSDLLAPGSRLAPGATATLAVAVAFDPGEMAPPFYNQALLSGVDAATGDGVADWSDAGWDPESPGNAPTPIHFDPTLLGTAALGVSKRVESLDAAGDGYYIEFHIRVENLGPVRIDRVQVLDDLALAFPAPARVDVVSGPTVTGALSEVNADFGTGRPALLSGAQFLDPGAAADIRFGVRLVLDGAAGPFANQALATGLDPRGDPVSDLSDAGADPDPDGDGDPGGEGEDDATPIDLPAGVRGSLYRDHNHNRVRDEGDSPAEFWMVETSGGDGPPVRVVVDAQGEFEVPELPPGEYLLSFLNPDNQVAWGQTSVRILAGARPRIEALVDAQGIVYESGRRTPLPGVVLALDLPEGREVPAACLLPGQQNQTVDSSGAYRFDVRFAGDGGCPTSATGFRLRIVEVPGGFIANASVELPPADESLNLGECAPAALPCVVQGQSGPPTGSADTGYYLDLLWGPGDEGTANNHIPIDRQAQTAPGGELRVQFSVDRPRATIGEVLGFRVEVENLSEVPLAGVTTLIDPPAGLPALADSLVLVRAGPDAELDTADDQQTRLSLADPRSFEAVIGTLAAREAVVVRYAARVSPAILPGVKVSKADGVADNGVGDSASVSVRIEADPMLQKTTIIGKVFHDLDEDGVQDAGERGIPGVRLATLEGLLVETDAAGRYHIADVDTGRVDRGANFMIKLDALSLPEGLDARRVLRQVVRLTPGLMTRINFPIRTDAAEGAPSIDDAQRARTDGLRGEPRLDVLAIPGALVRNARGVQNTEFAVYSNYGLFIAGYRIALFDLTDPRFPRLLRPPELLSLTPVDGRSDLLTGSVDVPVDEEVRRIGYRLIALGSCVPDDNLPIETMMRLLEGGDAGAEAMTPGRGGFSSGMGVGRVFDQTAMRLLEVRSASQPPPAQRSAWEIFGHSNLAIQNIPVRGYQTIQRRGEGTGGILVDVEPIPLPEALRIGGSRGDLEATYQLIDQAGIRSDRRPMPLDSETWAVFDHEGLRPERVGIVEFDPNRSVGSIKKDLPNADPTGARGLHRTIMECGCTLMAAETLIDREDQSLSLRLTNLSELSQTPTLIFDAASGLADRTLRPMGRNMSQEIFLGRFDASGYASSADWRDLRVRFSTATPAGYVPEFQLERSNTFEPRIRASCDGVSAWPDTTSEQNLLAAMVVGGRDEPPPPAADALFAMGLVNLTLGANDVSGNLEALADDDHYDESVFVDGRVAGYLRGKIRGRYLVTAQLDTTEDELKNLGDNLQRKDPERIFRQLDPDRYYPVYGDDSTTTSDVESQGAMYVRVDWDDSSALWGNYNTAFTDTEFAQYNRSLYGARLDYASTAANRYGERRRILKLFAAEAETRSAQAAFRATGGSLYYLPHTDIVEGSEKLWIEVRARDSERVLDTEILLPGRDYEVDDLQGRILLARPLASLVRERSNSIVRSAPLDGDRVFLMVDYEHVPGDFAADDLTTGLRAKWTTDTLGLGLSRVDAQRDGRDYTLTGTDARWRFSAGSYLLGEFARTEARQNDVNTLSFDGGLTFSDALLPEASDALEGDAWGVEARVDLADLASLGGVGGESQGELSLWHKAREAGFSSGRLGESGEITDSGLSVDLLVSDRQTLSTSASRVEREFGRDESVVRAQTDVRLGCGGATGCLDLGLEGRYENRESDIPDDIAPVGDALLVGARLGKALSEATTLYGSAQTAAQSSSDYPGNDLFSVGMNQTLSDRLGVSVEVSDGDRGEALIAGVDYVRDDGTALNLSGGVGSGAMTQFGTRYTLAEGNEVYGSYTVDPDRTDGARNLLTLGQRRQMDDAVGVFTETTFGRDDGYADSAHVFGLDYQADQNWLISARLQASDLKREGVDMERQVASIGASHQADGRRIATRLEARRDHSGGLDTWQYLTSNLFGVRSDSGDRRWIGKLNLAWTDNAAAGVDDGRFVEFDLGYALRPIRHDRINALAKYTYLYDLGSNGQLGPNGRAENQLEERSHLASAELLYDLSGSALGVAGVEVGGKIAAKLGEQRVFESGDWYDTRLAFGAVRARYRLVGAEEEIDDGHWEALTEYRLLKDFEDDSLRHGALLGIYYVKPVSVREDSVQMRVGVGYNFTDFDSDLRQDGYRSGGWFIDVSAAY